MAPLLLLGCGIWEGVAMRVPNAMGSDEPGHCSPPLYIVVSQC